MNRRLLILSMTCLLAIGSLMTMANADVLTIPNMDNQPANSDEEVARPSRGMTMEEVKAQFGNPNKIIDAVGNPPITRWMYDKFTVHFEHNYVIHSVLQRKQ